METTRAERKHSCPTRVTGRHPSSPNVSLDAEQRQYSCSGQPPACEGHTLEVSGPARLKTQTNTISTKVGGGTVIVREDGSTANCTSSCLHIPAEKTFDTTCDEPMCNELAEGPAKTPCSEGGAQSQAAAEVSGRCGGVSGLKQKRMVIAESEVKEFSRRAFPPPRNSAPTPTDAPNSNRRSSQFTKFRSFLNVFFRHKVRANAYSSRSEEATVCRIQPQLVCVPPGSVFVPTDAEKLSDTKTRGVPGSSIPSQQSLGLTRTSDHVAAPHCYASTHDIASISGISRETCTYLDLSGRYDSSPSSSCETRSSITSGTGSVQPRDALDQRAFQQDITGHTAAFATLTNTGHKTGAAGKGNRRFCECGEPTPNAMSTQTPATVQGVNAAGTDGRGQTLESNLTATETPNKTGPQPAFKHPLHAKAHSDTQKMEVMRPPEEGYDSAAEMSVEARDHGRLTDELSGRGAGWVSIPSVTSTVPFCRTEGQQCIAPSIVRGISIQVAEDSGGIFQGALRRATEIRVPIGRRDFNTCHPGAADDLCKAGPGPFAEGGATVRFERTSAAIVRNHTPSGTVQLGDYAEERKATCSGSDTVLGSGTSTRSTHNGGEESSCSTFFIPTENFPAPNPSVAPAATPATVDTSATHLWKEDLLQYWPAEFPCGEEECCSSSGMRTFRASSTSLRTRSISGACVANSPMTSVTADERSSPRSVADTSTTTSPVKVASLDEATPLLSSEANSSRIQVRATAVRSENISTVSSTVSLSETKIPDPSAHAFAFSPTRSPFSREETMIDRTITGEHDFEPRRINSAEGGAIFRVGGAKRGQTVGHGGRDPPQVTLPQCVAVKPAHATPNLREVCITADFTTVPRKREAREPRALLTPLPVDEQVKHVVSLFPEDRSSKSAAEPVRRRTSGGISSRASSGPENGDFACSKLLCIVRCFQKSRQSGWLAQQDQQQQQQPDVRGGSIFLSTQEAGEAAVSHTSRVQQERAEGSGGCIRNQEYGKSVRRGSLFPTSIRRERSGDSRKAHSRRTSEEQKESRRDEEVVVLEGADIVVERSTQTMREEPNSHCLSWLSCRQVGTIGSATPVAVASVVSTHLMAVAPDLEATSPSIAAGTSRRKCTTTPPAAAGNQDESVAAVREMPTSISPAYQSIDRDVKATRLGTAAAAISEGSGVGEGVNSRRREGVHYSLLTWHSGVPRLKGKVERIHKEHTGKHSQQQEQTESRPHVWTGDSFGFQEFLEENAATASTPMVQTGIHNLPSSACNTSSAFRDTTVDTKQDLDEPTAASSFRILPEATAPASTRAPRSAVAKAGPAAHEAATAGAAAISGESGISARAASMQSTEECLLRTKRHGAETCNNGSPTSTRSRIFLSDLHTHPTETFDTVSCSRRKERLRNRPQRMASCPPLLCVHSSVEACLVQHHDLRPLSKGSCPELNAAGALTRDMPLHQQRDYGFAARCGYRTLQSRSAAEFPDRSLPPTCGRDTVSHRSTHPSIFLLLRPRASQVLKSYNLSDKQQQQRQRWKSESSLCSVRQGGCERVKRVASVYLEQRHLRCAQHKRNLQVQEGHVRGTPAGNLQGREFESPSLVKNSCSYAEKRKSVSLLFQRRKTAAAACGSRRRTMSLDAKHIREISKSLRHRGRRVGAEVLPCSSESETTRCATSCGEGEFDETTIVLRSAEAAASSVAYVAAAGESYGTSFSASLNHHSQVRKALQQRRRRCSDTGHLQKGRHKPYSTEMSSWHTKTAGGTTSAGRQASYGPYPCAAASLANMVMLRSAPDDTTLLHCLPPVTKTAQQTSSGDTVHLSDSDAENRDCSLAVVVDTEAPPRRSQSFDVSSRRHTYSSYVCQTTESTPDSVCSHDDGAPQENAQQQMTYSLLGNAEAESIVLRRTGERRADTECGDRYEEPFSEHDDDSGGNSPPSSMHSVVFTVEDSACEDFDDDDNLSFIELLPLLQHSLSQKVQHHPRHPTREHDNAATASSKGETVVKQCGYGAALLGEDGEGDTPTFLDCCQALETYLKEDAREVDVYVPPSLHNLSQVALCRFFDTTELSTPRAEATVVAVSPPTTAATTGGTPEGVEEGGRRGYATGVAEHTVAGTAVANYGIPRGAAGNVTTKEADLERQTTKGRLPEQKSAATLSVATASSASLTPPYLQAYLPQRASIISRNGNNTSVQHCSSNSRSEAECCSEPCSERTGCHKKVTLGCSDRESGESSSGSVSMSTTSSTGEGRIRDVIDRWGRESGKFNKEKWGQTHVKGFLSEKAAITCHVSSAEKSPAQPRPLSVGHPTDTTDVALVENSKGDIASADRTCEKPTPTFCSVPPVLPTSCIAADITDSSRQRADHVTGMVSLEGPCTTANEAGRTPFEWPRGNLCETRTEGDASVECEEEQLLEKPQHSHIQQQKQQDEQLQHCTQRDGRQQQECDLWNQEQQHQSAQQGKQEEKENAHAREQHRSNPPCVLHPTQGKSRGVVASDKHHVNSHETEGCTRWQSSFLQEASLGGRTAAVAAEKTHSREAAESPKDEAEEDADRGLSSNTEVSIAQQPIMETEVSALLEGHKRHAEQTSACKQANSPACNKQEDTTACLQRTEGTENGLSSTESAMAGRERVEANRSGTVIMQVKFSSLLLLLCDDNEELLANLPYFEGPLCLSTRNAALRRQCPSYPRLLKSVAPAAAPAERLFYFVLFRGHLFWFNERSAFTSRGFDACIGSVSLLLNACRIVCVEAPMQHQQKRLLWEGTSSNSSSNCGRLVTHAVPPSDVHDPGDRFSLQFYTHTSAWNAVDKPPSHSSNIRRGSGISRRSSFISGPGECAKENADARCSLLGEMELHVVSGAVFCPTAPVPVMNCREAPRRRSAFSAISAADNSGPPTVKPSDALSVYITGNAGTPGPTADDIAPVPVVSSPACEGSRGSYPSCNFSCTNSFPAAPAVGVTEATVPWLREVQNGREGSTTAAAGAVAAASAVSSFGRRGLGRSGRSAEKKAALASYAAAWVRHMQISIAQGEDLRRRFPEVNWAQHQLRARHTTRQSVYLPLLSYTNIRRFYGSLQTRERGLEHTIGGVVARLWF